MSVTKIELIALGTGSAFTMKGFQTNFILGVNDKKLLVDCGSDIRFSLRNFGLSYMDIDSVYLSHLHADHIGGMEYLGFCTYFDKRWSAKHNAPKPSLFCERNLLRDLWDHSLRGGMEGLEGIDANINTYFDAIPIEKNGHFVFEDVKVDIVQSIHISAKYCIVDSFGIMFTDPVNKKRVYLTTDLQFCPETSLKAYYKEADIIVHDCETMYKSGVHAHYDSLRTLSPELKAKMRLIHYQDNVLDNWDEWEKKAKDDGFYGFVKPGVIYSSDEA